MSDTSSNEVQAECEWRAVVGVKFHKVNNLLSPEGPSGSSFPVSNPGAWCYTSSRHQPERCSYLMITSHFRVFLSRIGSITDIISEVLVDSLGTDFLLG